MATLMSEQKELTASISSKMHLKSLVKNNVCECLAVLLGFVIPLSTSITNIVLLLLVLLLVLSWLVGARHQVAWLGARHQNGWHTLAHPVSILAFCFFGLFLVGSVYTEANAIDMRDSLWKMSKVLYLPLLLPLMWDKKWRDRGFILFGAALVLTFLLSFLKLYGHVPIPTKYTAASIFKNHIDTNLMMAFGAFLVAHCLIYKDKILNEKKGQRYLGCALVACFSFYVLWMSEGRSGYIIFAVLWLLFCVQRFSFKKILWGVVTLVILFSVVLQGSTRFQTRFQEALQDSAEFRLGKTDTSLGARLEYSLQTFNLAKQHPWFGFGTGAFKQIYLEHAQKNALAITRNPHNEYVNVLLQLGGVGLIGLLALFLGMLKLSFRLTLPEQYLAQGLVLSMLVGCFANSWMMDFTSGYFFIVLSAYCFGAFNNSTRLFKNKNQNTIKIKNEAALPAKSRSLPESFSSSSHSPKVSVIVTTYNWPEALKAVLTALENQTFRDFEIIVADDGSGPNTTKMLQSIQIHFPISIQHIWQDDLGFRAAMIRNKAVMAAKGDYIIFLDGDCIPRAHFIERHYALAEKGFFVVGNRILLSRELTLKVLLMNLPLHTWPLSYWFWIRLKGQCNRMISLIRIPLPWKKYKPFDWKGAKGCNLAVWKADLLKVNGWEEKFEGWGYEDSDLVIRLINSGIKRKEGRFLVPVIHLWHKENDRIRERQNWSLLESQLTNKVLDAVKGLNQYQ